MSVSVRDLRASDEARWRELWAGYLEFYEHADLAPSITEHTWAMMTGARDDVFAFVAEHQGRVVGLVHCVVHANTWADTSVCYLEDLFVDPASRGIGAGRALIEAVIHHAQYKGWAQVYWRTATGNPARALYDQMGETIDFVTYVRKLTNKSV